MAARVADNPDKSRYEIFEAVDEGGAQQRAGFAEYHLYGNEIAFIHTEVDPRFGGRGLGGILVRGALDAARDRGLEVLPFCPFVRGWIGRHPEYRELVPEGQRARFGF
ncbi:N-acetyltransferase [Streptomyces cocklensis]|uniref:N-acetyltransferase domain-containing protein n=1 Tax=Actinacidiphila cocklensis TaxID=887465 RepID=A0A9W4EAC7_9ACTN|nr:GNAT family N-acetyltransferase [Actinacidiphila cocklensis]MDD1059892.1 N-acetyltransferase [Actinacidiphila cocklensis]WSX72759.1 N-acetyltransferase [Streptomyces sp. NBC_00899]WSX81173.1 N-acetyltransferase [Streptomyces sp. NBC_00899]CAG6397198.1 N-acetyltransferase domain-containing protein [Actinacidiphila cocklensis]